MRHLVLASEKVYEEPASVHNCVTVTLDSYIPTGGCVLHVWHGTIHPSIWDHTMAWGGRSIATTHDRVEHPFLDRASAPDHATDPLIGSLIHPSIGNQMPSLLSTPHLPPQAKNIFPSLRTEYYTLLSPKLCFLLFTYVRPWIGLTCGAVWRSDLHPNLHCKWYTP